MTLVLLSIIYIITCGMWGWIETSFSKDSALDSPSYSMGSSEKRGSLISSMSINPSYFNWKGHRIEIESAWIEHRFSLSYIVVVIPRIIEFPIYRHLNGYNFCFTMKKEWNNFDENSSFFVLGNQGKSFGKIGSLVFYEHMQDLRWDYLTINLTDNWQFTNVITLTASRGEVVGVTPQQPTLRH